uniref:Uncharacterized protein n=1 Tax=Octopus bimaculoides TaxID=37653 RepID=A0A0L8H7Q2_OCTBM
MGSGNQQNQAATAMRGLGKMVDELLSDGSNVINIVRHAEEWLRMIDRSGLPGMFRAWLFQHGLLPRLIWLLMLYDVPMTIVERVERKIHKYLRRLLGVPQASVGL